MLGFYRGIEKKMINTIKRIGEKPRMTEDNFPIFNNGEHHLLDLSDLAEDEQATVSIKLPNGKSMAVAFLNSSMSSILIADITTYDGSNCDKTSSLLGVKKSGKETKLEDVDIYSLMINK